GMRDWKPEHRGSQRHDAPRLASSLAYAMPDRRNPAGRRESARRAAMPIARPGRRHFCTCFSHNESRKEVVMNLVRWDPFRELEGIQARLNHLFGDTPRAFDDDRFFANW